MARDAEQSHRLADAKSLSSLTHKIARVHDVRDAWLARRESAFGAWLGVGCRLPRGDWQ